MQDKLFTIYKNVYKKQNVYQYRPLIRKRIFMSRQIKITQISHTAKNKINISTSQYVHIEILHDKYQKDKMTNRKATRTSNVL